MPPKSAGSTEGGDKMMAGDRMSGDPRMAPSTGKKVIFTDLEAAEALAAKGPTVLFFAADWCPTCQAALKDINENGSRLGEITVVVVDYDKATDLKSAYGVTYQHTFVQIDADGKAIVSWNGGGVDEIVKKAARRSSTM